MVHLYIAIMHVAITCMPVWYFIAKPTGYKIESQVYNERQI